MNNTNLNQRMSAYWLIYFFHANTELWSVITLDNLHYCEPSLGLARGVKGQVWVCWHADEKALTLPD